MNYILNKHAVTIMFIFLILIVGILSVVEYWLGVGVKIIVVSVSVISAAVGYFITHFLEIERRRIKEKTKLYTGLVSALRVFMKPGKEILPEDMKNFEDTYYTSWLYISTNVYKKLTEYAEQYKLWSDNKNEQNSNVLNKKLTLLMQAMRDEVTVDKKAEFKNYILQQKQ